MGAVERYVSRSEASSVSLQGLDSRMIGELLNPWALTSLQRNVHTYNLHLIKIKCVGHRRVMRCLPRIDASSPLCVRLYIIALNPCCMGSCWHVPPVHICDDQERSVNTILFRSSWFAPRCICLCTSLFKSFLNLDLQSNEEVLCIVMSR